MNYQPFYGTIIHGLALGRELGFPTANISVEKGCPPPKGVYLVEATVNGLVLGGIMNVGSRPSINNNDPSIEVHLLHFHQNIYHCPICIYPLEKIRDEEKFNSLEELKKQLTKDKELAVSFFENN